jgi:hypothetical protein
VGDAQSSAQKILTKARGEFERAHEARLKRKMLLEAEVKRTLVMEW